MGRNTLVSTHTSPTSTAYASKIVATHNRSLRRVVCDTRAPCAQGPQSPQKEFDSTLGYPGEGPIVPKLVVATFNVQGLKRDTTDSDHYQPKLKKLLHWAKKHNVDAICIQEHNCGTNEFNRLRNGCNAFGYCLIMARRDLPEGRAEEDNSALSTRGGAALLLRTRSFEAGAEESEEQAHHNGRVATREVVWEEQVLQLASIYVPAAPGQRRAFLNNLIARNPLQRNAIVGGDFNTVIKVSEDVQFMSDQRNRQGYQNLHGAILNQLMHRTKLSDLHNRINGEATGGYTREAPAIHTRIDRIYAREDNSVLSWQEVRVGIETAELLISDHYPVIATAAALGRAKHKTLKPKINTEILLDPGTREEVKETISEVVHKHRGFRGPKAPRIWEEIKRNLYTTLKRLTKRKSKEARKTSQYSNLLGLELRLRVRLERKEKPSVDRATAVNNLKEQIREEHKRLKPASGQNAWKRMQSEELMTKTFFRKFRNKNANANITELHQVEDWDNPEMGGTTQDDDQLEMEATKYYKWLYQKKTTCPEAARDLLDMLRDDPIPPHIADESDTPIGLKHVLQAIRASGTGKSPGPDGLPSEIYKTYEDLLAPILSETIQRSYDAGILPDTMQEGEVALIYKKKDPKDIRNYRPITLLNNDYKILARVLTEKIKGVCEAAISNQQKGFVPGRQITDLIRQMHLVQEYVNAKDMTGVVLLLDMEKAFDRCSWDFLKNSLEAIGVGPRMRKWVDMIYSERNPPKRSLRINGQTGRKFVLGSGVAQGCPLSPLLFLFIGEPLTRAIDTEEDYEGIEIGNTEHRALQFADDTAAMAKDWDQIPKLMNIIKKWENATAMRANRAKTAIIPIGRTARLKDTDAHRPPTRMLEELGLPGPSTERWEIYLGAPIASDVTAYKEFLEHKYRKIKQKMAGWKGLRGHTAHGRTMIANSLIFSQMRYWVQLLHVPKEIHEWIKRDSQALLWNKDIKFDKDELGTDKTNRRFMKEGSEINPRKELGLGLLPWDDHVKAIQAKAALSYLDGSRGLWKEVLDEWILEKHAPYGRGAILMDIPDKTSKMKAGNTPLPAFWKEAIKTLDSLPLEVIDKDAITRAQARAEPIWHSHHYDLGEKAKLKKLWEEDLETTCIGDLLREDKPWSRNRLEHWIARRDNLNKEYRGDEIIIKKALRGSTVTELKMSDILDNYEELWENIPQFLKDKATNGGNAHTANDDSPTPPPTPPREQFSRNRHARIIEDSSSDSDDSNSSCTNSAEGQENAKLIAHEGNGLITYGYLRESELQGERRDIRIQQVRLSPRGFPINTERTIRVDREGIVEIERWKGTVRGPATESFPSAKNHTLRGIPGNKPLEKITINDLTAAIRNKRNLVVPTCKASWPQHLPEYHQEIPWKEIGRQLATNAGTTRDTGSWFKNILHRSMYLRARRGAPHTCLACDTNAPEDWSHFWRCPTFFPVWSKLLYTANDATEQDRYEMTAQFVYLGIDMDGGSIKGTLALLHKIVWKFIILEWMKASQEHREVRAERIWRRAVRRLVTRVNAQARAVQRQNFTDKGRKITRKWEALNNKIAPLAKINPRSARVEWCQNIKEEFRNNHAINEDREDTDESDVDTGDASSEEDQAPLEDQEQREDPQDDEGQHDQGGRREDTHPTPHGEGRSQRQRSSRTANHSRWTPAQQEAYNRYQLVGGIPPAFLQGFR